VSALIQRLLDKPGQSGKCARELQRQRIQRAASSVRFIRPGAGARPLRRCLAWAWRQ
jgi:hypothetical protein